MKINLIWLCMFIVLRSMVESLPVERRINTQPYLKSEDILPDSDKKVSEEFLKEKSPYDGGWSKKQRDRSRAKHRRIYVKRPHRTNTKNEQNRDINVAAPSENIEKTEIPPALVGANIEFIKQLNARKESKTLVIEPVNPYKVSQNKQTNSSNHDILSETRDIDETSNENPENIVQARSASRSNNNQSAISKRQNSPRLTNVHFSIVHDHIPEATSSEKTSKITSSETVKQPKLFEHVPKVYSEPAKVYSEPAKFYSEPAKIYSEPAKIYSEPAKVYSEPAKIYSEPAKVYSEPAKVYSEPEKVYGEPAKVYSEPAKIYSEPEKVYSEPASLYLDHNLWQPTTEVAISTSSISTIAPNVNNTKAKQNISDVSTQIKFNDSISSSNDEEERDEESDENCKNESCKVGYVVEGRQYRKYRVEERTADGFIVGEYGVVRNEDGDLRGVRYTADSEASPRLIYDALMKFLQL